MNDIYKRYEKKLGRKLTPDEKKWVDEEVKKSARQLSETNKRLIESFGRVFDKE